MIKFLQKHTKGALYTLPLRVLECTSTLVTSFTRIVLLDPGQKEAETRNNQLRFDLDATCSIRQGFTPGCISFPHQPYEEVSGLAALVNCFSRSLLPFFDV